MVNQLTARALVPLYEIDASDEEKEVQAAAHVVATVADKLHRLTSAYGEWRAFDVPAFFDLYPEQVALLVHLTERVTAVHVTFYADLLLPSFQRTERYWAEEFFPAYQAAYPFTQYTDKRSSYTEHFLEITQPKLIAYWDRLRSVVQQVRNHLSEDIGFLAAAGGSEERAQWRRYWPDRPANGLDRQLLTPLAQIPTLTLSIAFPLPAHRQPGRMRRLRRMWQRKGWQR